MTTLFNDNWTFCKFPIGTSYDGMHSAGEKLRPVEIPHDWLISCEDLYEDGIGYYRKCFSYEKAFDGEVVKLRFDGIYMDSRIYLNGKKVGEWKYGYTTFEVDLTNALIPGENVIEVTVTHQSPNSRWYSGAGIYRNVWLKRLPNIHILSDGIYFSAKQKDENAWDVSANVELEKGTAEKMSALPEGYSLEVSLQYSAGMAFQNGKGDSAEKSSNLFENVDSGMEFVLSFETCIQNPKIWDIEDPNCYTLVARLYCQNESGERKLLQEEAQTVGFRTIAFSPEQGFLLNGRKVKLQGVCEHHDLGCLGSAFYVQAMERKLRTLREMGVNAIRLSHNMPAPEVMELADRMGFVVDSEAFDMWEGSKTTYDYARFFADWYQRDVERWIRRDRNHPSVILWSMGNEIYDTHAGIRGYEICQNLIEEVQKYDPRENAKLTVGSNYMPWENAQKCAELYKHVGYNYAEKYYDEHHKKHPDWVIYGSETGSVVQSRGIYHFPYKQSVLTDVDEQCSALGNSTTSWGAESAESCLKAEIEHPYSCGQFIWTGFDYIGEPTPYHTKNSYFGQIDTAGFPKDSFYIYQAGWRSFEEHPMVHIFPYWDFNEGQLVDIRICSNAPKVELFVNGKSQGICELEKNLGGKGAPNGEQDSGDDSMREFSASYQVPYEKGEIEAVAYNEKAEVVCRESRHSFGETASYQVELATFSEAACAISPQGAANKDLVFVTITARDENGYLVENANDEVRITVENGVLLGTDNGDSTDPTSYQSDVKRLFGGKLLAVCRANGQGKPEISVQKTDKVPVRAILLTSDKGQVLSKDCPETRIQAKILPENADDRELLFSIVDDSGIELKNASIERKDDQIILKAKSDGSFRLRCMSKAGTDRIRIISSLEFRVEGFGKAFTDPYEFVTAGLYDFQEGTVTNGNEHGVATARDGRTLIGFSDLFFGSYGSDEITIPIFALNDDLYQFNIYEIHKEKEKDQQKELLGTFRYQKPSIWNVYQEETYRLPKRLQGVVNLAFEWDQKVHMKGFSFKKLEKAWQKLSAGECDKVYGDQFEQSGDKICNIGNNVTIEFADMDFGDKGTNSITICGYTPLEKNAIVLQFVENGQEIRRVVEFKGNQNSENSGEASEQTFEFEPVYGKVDVNFVFLPGSSFDFYSFKFDLH